MKVTLTTLDSHSKRPRSSDITFPYATVGGDFIILDPQRTLLRIDISQFSMKERVAVVRKLTHLFVPYLKVGHMNSDGAMTMGRMTYVVLSMALLTKLR